MTTTTTKHSPSRTTIIDALPSLADAVTKLATTARGALHRDEGAINIDAVRALERAADDLARAAASPAACAAEHAAAVTALRHEHPQLARATTRLTRLLIDAISTDHGDEQADADAIEASIAWIVCCQIRGTSSARELLLEVEVAP